MDRDGIARSSDVNRLAELNHSGSKSRSWIGVMVVILGSAFLLLTLNEGKSSPFQPLIDSLFHNWLITALVGIAAWLARREALGPLRSRFLRGLSGLVASYFALFSSVAFFTSQMLWDVLKPLRIVQPDIEPAAVFGVIWLWGIAWIVLFARRVFRWFRKRYEHHVMAIGFGPLYFYFRRGRVPDCPVSRILPRATRGSRKNS